VGERACATGGKEGSLSSLSSLTEKEGEGGRGRKKEKVLLDGQ